MGQNLGGPGANNPDIEHEEFCDDKFEKCNDDDDECIA